MLKQADEQVDLLAMVFADRLPAFIEVLLILPHAMIHQGFSLLEDRQTVVPSEAQTDRFSLKKMNGRRWFAQMIASPHARGYD